MKLKESFLRRLTEIQGTAVGFRIDQVRLPNDKTAKREYLNHPGAVAVVAIHKNNIVFVKQYRHPVQKITWEIPAGKLAKGENPLSCVKRELEEETGFKAKRFKKIISYWPTAAFANEVIHIYLAKNLTIGSVNPDDDEFIAHELWPVKKALRAIQLGRIKDSKTVIGILTWLVWHHRFGGAHKRIGNF